MKTTYTIDEVEEFLARIRIGAIRGSVRQLTEGHTSQVFSFERGQGLKYVIRLRKSKKDLQADQYAFKHFSSHLPIPEVIDIGVFDDNTHFAITPLIEGETLSTISQDLSNQLLMNVKDVIANTFTANISHTSGYGDPDFKTGNAPAASWQESLKNELSILDPDKLRHSAVNIGLSRDLVDALIKQFNTNLPYVSEQRRLLHGDPGGDNVIIADNKVVALLDWEQMAYGDWLRDYSRFEYWNNNSYGDAESFADMYKLEKEHIKERKAVYWAINALRGIEFADRDKSEKVAMWLQNNLQRIIL